MDTRKVNTLLNDLKDKYPDQLGLIESIQLNFNEEFKPLSSDERKALITYPVQYVKKINDDDDGSWTSQLHIWAEQGVPEIIDIDPMLLTFKNSHGDTVLHSLITGLTGAYTEKIDYNNLEKLLTKELSYEETVPNSEETNTVSPFNEKDTLGKTPLDYVISYAYGTDMYEGTNPDQQLIDLLIRISSDDTNTNES